MASSMKLEDFHISEEHGFLLSEPLEKLPDYFSAWNYLAKQMPELVVKKQLREAVDKLEVLDHTRLNGYKEWRLAHVQLSFIAAGYIWQEGDVGASKVLPRCIALPWCGVSDYLGIQPILCHPSFALANWKYDNKTGELRSLYNMPGGSEAEWFVTVTVETELKFAAALKDLILAMDHAEMENIEGLTECLSRIPDTVNTMKKTVAKMHQRLKAGTFYNVVRPYLNGWGGAGSPLPDGLIYEGVSPQPKKLMGASAAQSSTLQCLDAVLGIKHSPENHDFLEKMRQYMPRAHSKFLQTVESQSKVKDLVNRVGNEQLTSAYDRCVQSVIDFRSYHIQIVTKYVVVMAHKETRNHDHESLATKGTGGSDLIPFLKSLRTTTKQSLHDGPPGKEFGGSS